MTYNVFGGTLSLTQLNSSIWPCLITPSCCIQPWHIIPSCCIQPVIRVM